VPAVGHRPPARAVSYAVDQLGHAEERTTWKVGQGRSEALCGLATPIPSGEVAGEQMAVPEHRLSLVPCPGVSDERAAARTGGAS
jgi:hypothetical protein